VQEVIQEIAMSIMRHTKTIAINGQSIFAVAMMFGTASVAKAGVAFQYDPIANPITEAWFSVDFAAMNAHRTLSGYEMNFVQLVDCNVGSNLPDYDLSDDLFGTSVFPDTPDIDMGILETGIITASIDSSFYDVLAGGNVGLIALFTDTVDAMFAMDFISLTIETSSDTIVSYYGWPEGNENNGFGIGLADGGDLPSPLPDSLPIGLTGTGFDETVSSKSIHAIPAPATLSLLAVLGLCQRRRR